jgi:hypothetical protein
MDIEETVVEITKNEICQLKAENRLLKEKLVYYEEACKKNINKTYKFTDKERPRVKRIIEYLENEIDDMQKNLKIQESDLLSDIMSIAWELRMKDYNYEIEKGDKDKDKK